jgi:Carboxypeptidase regulatory-like domain/TonB dependent receptor
MGITRGSIWKAICFLSVLCFVFALTRQSASAQILYGSLVGTVTDQSGAVVPGAEVKATDIQTGQVHQDTSDASGRYNIVNVQPGTYSETVTAKGFKNFEQTNLIVTPNVVTRTDVHLEVGQASESVTVSAEATQLQTDKGDTHTEITGRSVTNLPLGGTRNYQTLIDLSPGAMPGQFVNSITDVPGHPNATNINGGNAQTNITKIDGAESINVWLPQYSGYVVPAETVDVVNVTTSAADAAQGLAGSSAITVVTKSGTNEIHGSAFEFHNDQALNARNFFLQAGQAKPTGIYNNWGGTIGGPILKNKLFYFGSFDGTNQKNSGNGLYSVPTADQRAGNFSAYNTTIYDPATGNADGTGRTPFANGIIPTSRITPQAAKLQSYIPLPNESGTSNNFAATGGPILDRYQTDVKVNWNRNDKHSIYFKYDNMVATSGGVGVFGVAGGPSPNGDPGTGHTTVNVGSIGHTYAFSPTVVLDGTVGYQRMNQNVVGADYGTNYGTTLGIPGLNGPDIRQSGFPNISFGSTPGTSSFYTETGVPNWMPLFRTDETYSNSDNLTWTKGAHELRFGFDVVRHHLNHWQPELSLGGPRGLLNFSGQTTSLNGGAAPNQYNSYAQFLLGYSDDLQKGLQYILMTGREWQFGGYAQDRWQVSPKLTVTLGVRYEVYPLMTRSDGKGIERYDPTTNNVYLGGRGSVPQDVGITVSHKLFAPRAGIAYRLDDKTVIRMGYGLNYDPLPFSRPLRGFYPLTINAETNSPNSFSYAGTLASGIPPVVGPDLSTGIVQLPGNASERSPWAGEIHRGYVQSWNFTVERKLPGDVVTSVGYVGQHSTHLLADRDINAGYPGSGTTGLPYYASFGRTVPTNMWDGYLSSSYNSLQVAVNRSFSKGLMLKGAYTYAHAIDYTDEDGWASVGWNQPSQFQRNRATADFNRSHVFQLGWVYDLPFGKDKAFLTTGLVSKIVGGWEFSGIESCYTGTRFTVMADGTSLNAPNNWQTANQVMASVPFVGAVGPGQYYYNPAAFAPVSTQSYGNSGRNILTNPGLWNTDMSIVRNFAIREKATLQFRTEFYNLPNTSHFYPIGGFGSTSTQVNTGSFMQVTSSYDERNIRFALRLQW